MGATVLPTDCQLIQVPEIAAGQNIRLEFAYGCATQMEKTVGWACVRPGAAISFVHLDSGVQLCNSSGDNSSIEEGTIKVVNNDLAPVSVSVFRAPETRKHFESALIIEQLPSGEERQLPLPTPCVGRIFQVEVKHERAKTI